MNPKPKKEPDTLSTNRYTATLSFKIAESQKGLGILKEIQSGGINITNISYKSWLQKMIIEWVVIQIDSLFDRSPSAVSFKQLLKHNPKIPEERKEGFNKRFTEIQNEHSALIERIGNNRNKSFAHTQRAEELGWSKEIIEAATKIGLNVNGLEVVEPQMEHLALTNLPTEEMLALLDKLEKLLFYEIDYPDVNKIFNS